MRNGNALLEIFSHVKKNYKKQTKYCAEPRKRRKRNEKEYFGSNKRKYEYLRDNLYVGCKGINFKIVGMHW